MGGKNFLTYLSLYLCGAALGGTILSCPTVASAANLASHKAVYDVQLVSAKAGSPILNISGKLTLSVKKNCDGWSTNHKFDLGYEFANNPPTRMEAKFAGFERLKEKTLEFSSSRISDEKVDLDIRGTAQVFADKPSEAVFRKPENLKFALTNDTLFPMAHTDKLIEAAVAKKKIMNATVFDGSDDLGASNVNAVIGSKVCSNDKDPLLTGCGWNFRMAFFPVMGKDSTGVADYEVTMKMLENGVVQDMVVDYPEFKFREKLVKIEPIQEEKCGVE